MFSRALFEVWLVYYCQGKLLCHPVNFRSLYTHYDGQGMYYGLSTASSVLLISVLTCSLSS